MSRQFPSASLARRLSVGASELLEELKVPYGPESSPVATYIGFLLDRFKELWIAKHGEGYGADDETVVLKNTEALVRYVQLNLHRALYRDPANGGPPINSLEILSGHENILTHEPPFPREWQIRIASLVSLAAKQLGAEVPLSAP